MVNYGDGTASQDVVLVPDAAGKAGTATLSHTYVDNGTYVVALSLIDADGYAYRDSFAVTVSNVAPTVKLSKSWINSRGWVGVTGSFTDPGEDTWTATIDFGDGSGPLPLTLKDNKTFTMGHSYSEGHYTVKVAVRDDDGGEGSSTCTAIVVEPSSNSLLGNLLLDGGAIALYDDIGCAPPALVFDPTVTTYYCSGALTLPY